MTPTRTTTRSVTDSAPGSASSSASTDSVSASTASVSVSAAADSATDPAAAAATTPPSAPTDDPQHRAYRSGVPGGQTFVRSARAEWVKLWSLRSTWIASIITIALTAFFGAAIVLTMFFSSEGQDAGAMQATAKEMIGTGTSFGQIVICVQAALVITGEYATGQIRSSLAAVPRRGRLLMAKTLIVSVHAFLLGVASLLLTWVVSAPFMGGQAGSLTDPEYLGYFWGAGLSFVVIALMCLGLGFLLRSTAGAITVAVIVLFVAQIPLQFAANRWEWAGQLLRLLPLSVSSSVSDPFSRLGGAWGQPDALDHWQAVLVFAAWGVVPMLAAWAVFSRRNA